MRVQRKIYANSQEKQRDFALGILAFIVVNGLLATAFFGLYWLVSLTNLVLDAGTWYAVSGAVLMLINIALLAFLGYWRSYMCLGALSTLGAMLVISLVAGLLVWVVCFVVCKS